MDCETCRWFSETFTQHEFGGKIHKGICLLKGCDGTYYERILNEVDGQQAVIEEVKDEE